MLVLEASPDLRGLPIQVPALVATLYQQGKYHWGYQSEPEARAGGKRLPYKLGRILGGSSAINAMLWVRGNQDVEPIFRRIETFEDGHDAHMGQDGPISISRGDSSSSPLNQAFLQAAKEAGLRRLLR